MPDEDASRADAERSGPPPPIFQPGSIPSGSGGLLMLGAVIAAGLLATRGPTLDQIMASGNLQTAAQEYKRAEKRLVEAIISADKNDLGRNEIARRVEGIYSRQTVLALLGSADLLQRAMTALEESGLTGADVRVWQGKGRRLLMELIKDGSDQDRLNTSRAALKALNGAGISTQGGGFANPAKHLTAGKVLELASRTPDHPTLRS